MYALAQPPRAAPAPPVARRRLRAAAVLKDTAAARAEASPVAAHAPTVLPAPDAVGLQHHHHHVSHIAGVALGAHDATELSVPSAEPAPGAAPAPLRLVRLRDSDPDLFRDTPLRYLGYANEVGASNVDRRVETRQCPHPASLCRRPTPPTPLLSPSLPPPPGEALATFLPAWGLPASYGVAILYVLSDTASKAAEAHAHHEAAPGDDDAPSSRARAALVVGADTLLWQALASVLWPGSVIRLVVALDAFGMAHVGSNLLPPLALTHGVDLRLALPTLAGLVAIPWIVKPIDGVVDAVAEASVAKALGGELKGPRDVAAAAAVLGGAFAAPPALFAAAAALAERTAELRAHAGLG